MKMSFLLFVCLGYLMGYCVAVKPMIKISPKSVTVREGEEVILPCVVDYVPARETEPVQWVRGDLGGLGSDRELKHYPRYSFTGDVSLGEYNLSISNAQVSDEDLYECQVTKYGLRSGKVKLSVLAPSKRLLINGTIGQPDVQLDVVQGKETTITCTSEGAKPPAALNWYKNGLKKTKGFRTKQTDKLYNTTATLRLTPTVYDKNATYTCIALNSSDHNEIFLKASLTLNFILKPIVKLNVSKILTAGEDATATCETHLPTADTQYRWYLNETKLPDIGYQLRRKFNKTWDKANLSCQAENIAGLSNLSSKTLNVAVTSTSDPGALSSSSNIALICGGVAGGIIIIIVVVIIMRKYRSRDSNLGSPEENAGLNEENPQHGPIEEKHSKPKTTCYHVADIPSHACTPPSTDYGSDDSNVTSRQDEGYMTSGTNYSTKSKKDPQGRFAATPLLPEIVLPGVMESRLSSPTAYAPSSLGDYPYQRPIVQESASAYGAGSQLAPISRTSLPRIPNFRPSYSDYPYLSAKPNVDSELPLGADAAGSTLRYDTSGRTSNMSHASHSSRSTDSRPFVSKRATHV